MSTIIKAADLNRDVQGVAFNFDDMTAKAQKCLDQVRAEADRIIAQARADADRIRREAQAEGRRAGQAEIERIVQKQLAPQWATVRQIVQEIRHSKQAWLTHWEKSGVHVAAAIAQRLIRRELEKTPQITLTLVREALELAVGSSQLRVHLNPADHETLRPHLEGLIAELAPLGTAELVADPAIQRGGCRLETRFGVVDQQFDAQLARIEEELT
jgi:flagellar assembly protein FliH